MDSAATNNRQQRAEEQIRAIVHDLSAGIAADVAADTQQAATKRVEEARQQGARELWERVNQTVRIVQRTSTRSSLFDVLLDAAATHATHAAVFTFDETSARAEAQRNLGSETLTFPSQNAAAFLSVLETRDPVAAATTASEISPELSGALEDSADRAHLFPLLVRDQTAAVLFTAGATEPAALEALASIAAMKLEAMQMPAAAIAKPATAEPLVQLDTAAPKAKGWTELTAEEQRLHLRAQRFARVKAAELRLAGGDKWKRGVRQSDIYAVLQPEVDRLRGEYREQFVTGSPSMVDYLHLELIRSLANHDERLLGPHYPGPLV